MLYIYLHDQSSTFEIYMRQRTPQTHVFNMEIMGGLAYHVTTFGGHLVNLTRPQTSRLRFESLCCCYIPSFMLIAENVFCHRTPSIYLGSFLYVFIPFIVLVAYLTLH